MGLAHSGEILGSVNFLARMGRLLGKRKRFDTASSVMVMGLLVCCGLDVCFFLQVCSTGL